jgi:hypothetical protein
MMRLGDGGNMLWMGKKRQTEKEWRKTKGISTANNKGKIEFQITIRRNQWKRKEKFARCLLQPLSQSAN